ncbi:Splicing factor u2af 35 kda subunit, partial [Globisporangium splendens]
MSSRYGGGDDFRGRGRDRSRDRGYGNYNGRGYNRGGGDRDRMMGRRGGGGGGEQSGGGAEHLARIHGTEEDRVNCPFYFKIGACRHGDRCSRLHNKPVFSQTILVSHMYQNPISQIIAQNGDPSTIDQKQVDEDFEDFYEEVFEELCKFGRLEELNICDNLGDHLVGNMYAKFEDEECAAAAQKSLYGRFYAGRPLVCEFSPVTDFREARCRQFDEGTCNRGGYCNFMHIKTVPRSMQRAEVAVEAKDERAKVGRALHLALAAAPATVKEVAAAEARVGAVRARHLRGKAVVAARAVAARRLFQRKIPQRRRRNEVEETAAIPNLPEMTNRENQTGDRGIASCACASPFRSISLVRIRGQKGARCNGNTHSKGDDDDTLEDLLGLLHICVIVASILFPSFMLEECGIRILIEHTVRSNFNFPFCPRCGAETHVDGHEHLLYGRISYGDVSSASAFSARGLDDEGALQESVPLPFAQVTLKDGNHAIAMSSTDAYGSYSMLFTMTASAHMNRRRKRPQLKLQILKRHADPCRDVNVTKRCSFGKELLEVMELDPGMQDRMIWKQSFEIKKPECHATAHSSHSETLLGSASHHELQAHEFLELIQEKSKERFGELPVPLDKSAIFPASRDICHKGKEHHEQIDYGAEEGGITLALRTDKQKKKHGSKREKIKDT